MEFTKYHALGNDYIVIDPRNYKQNICPQQVALICNRHYGIGSDGILYGPLSSASCDFSLRIFNPDGSEAEKSGNGLRIFSRYLWDQGLVQGETFSIETLGGKVFSTVHESGTLVSVAMGKVRFTHETEEHQLNRASAKTIIVKDRTFEFYLANVGNPHCVIPVGELSPSLAKSYGKSIETDPQFTNRTNVQFVNIVDRNTIQIEIWERGAGYTLASGSSSTAAAAVAYAMDWCGPDISVHMPGGVIDISLDESYFATMKGPVCKIAEGQLARETLSSISKSP